jgi:hypothetical protein
MIPAHQALRSLLALKLAGKERKSHVMDLVFDQGLALFAGFNVIPKRSYLAAYSSGIGQRTNTRLMETWFEHVRQAQLPRGDSLDLDFHTVPANTREEPLEKHYVSSRSQKGVLVFLARDATERVLCYANAGLTKAQQPGEILRFVRFWKQHTGHVPAELVFDSRLTTYAYLNKLNRQDIRFITLRRRSKKMLGQIWSQPVSAWHRIDPNVPLEESVGELARLKQEGKIRHVGVSNFKLDELERARRVVPIVSVQNRYNVGDRASEEVLTTCTRERIAFIPWAPLARGSSENLEKNDSGKGLEAVAQARGVTVLQLAIAWLLAKSPAMVPIPGTSSVEHLEENVESAKISLSQDEFEEISRIAHA